MWKHPNLRIAYVAQHAFHHLEQHLEKTPNQYIQWRYAIGEGRGRISAIKGFFLLKTILIYLLP